MAPEYYSTPRSITGHHAPFPLNATCSPPVSPPAGQEAVIRRSRPTGALRAGEHLQRRADAAYRAGPVQRPVLTVDAQAVIPW